MQRSESGCQQVISCGRYRTLCVRVGANELQIPWSFCSPDSMSALLIGEYETGLYSAAAEVSGSVCVTVHTHTYTRTHTQINFYHTKWNPFK